MELARVVPLHEPTGSQSQLRVMSQPRVNHESSQSIRFFSTFVLIKTLEAKKKIKIHLIEHKTFRRYAIIKVKKY